MRAMALVLLLLPLSGCFGLFEDDRVIPDEFPQTARLQPGSQLYFVDGSAASQCTAGFLFRSPDNETLYLSTSAHCLRPAGTLQVGDPVYDRVPGLTTRAIGTVAYDGWANGDQAIDRDFALVAISNREGVREHTNPAVKSWGGPLGLADSALAAPGQRVVAYGASSSRGADHPDNPREGRLLAYDQSGLGLLGQGDALVVASEKDTIPGDSGGPLMTWDGLALGILHGSNDVVVPVLIPQGMAAFTPVDINIQRARDAGVPVQLVTWPAFDGPGVPVAATGAAS